MTQILSTTLSLSTLSSQASSFDTRLHLIVVLGSTPNIRLILSHFLVLPPFYLPSRVASLKTGADQLA